MKMNPRLVRAEESCFAKVNMQLI